MMMKNVILAAIVALASSQLPSGLPDLPSGLPDGLPDLSSLFPSGGEIKADFINSLEDLKASGLTADQWATINVDELKKIKGEIMKEIPSDTLKSWAADTWAKLDFSKVTELQGDQIPSIPADEFKKWTNADIGKLKAHFGSMMNSDQIAAMKDKLITMKADGLKNFDLQALKDSTVFDELPTGVQTALEALKSEMEARKVTLQAVYAKLKTAKAKLTTAVTANEANSTPETEAVVSLAREELAVVDTEVAAVELAADNGNSLAGEDDESAAFVISPMSALLVAATPILAALFA